MASVTGGGGLESTANVAAYSTGSFTPAVGDQLVLFGIITATALDGTVTDSHGDSSWTFIDRAQRSVGPHLVAFVRDDHVASATGMIVTLDVTGDNGTGALLKTVIISGLTAAGIAAILQSTKVQNQAAGGTPAITFASACQTGNPTVVAVTNVSNPAAVTEPSGWTELYDNGHASPDNGMEVAARNSGFTGTTVTWGSTSATAFGALGLEIDASGGGVTLTVQDVTHGHNADSPALTQANTLAVQDVNHGHNTDSPALTQANVLTIQDVVHAHNTDSPALTQANVLNVSDAIHGHVADSPTLTQDTPLVVADVVHAHNIDSPALVQANVLAVQDVVHAHNVDSPALTQANVLTVQDVVHAHIIDSILLNLPGGMTPLLHRYIRDWGSP